MFNSRIQNLGRYAFVLHYYQPNHPTFPVEVLINGGRIWQGEMGRVPGKASGGQKPSKRGPGKFFMPKANGKFSKDCKREERLTRLFETRRA